MAANVPVRIRIRECPPALYETLVEEWGKGSFNGTLYYVQKKYKEEEQTVIWHIYDTEWVSLKPRAEQMPADLIIELITYIKRGDRG